jgi:hypothetical protein
LALVFLTMQKCLFALQAVALLLKAWNNSMSATRS